MRHKQMVIAPVLLAVAAWGLGGCAADHKMRTGSEGSTVVCRECYDQAVQVWEKGGYLGARWYSTPASKVRVEHQCASCKTTMVVHTEDGRWTIKCPTCAPEGVACDKCLPGDVPAKPSAAK